MFFHKSYFIRCYFALPVIFVHCLIWSIVYCYDVGFISEIEMDTNYFSLLTFYYTDLVLLIWSYTMSTITDPGSIPENYILEETEINPDLEDADMAKLSKAKRFCEKCDKHRPPRTHHCSLCNRCILKMDHHCPWIGNCVGFHNHRYFVQFLIYATIDCTLVGICCASEFVKNNGDTNYYNIYGMVAGLGLGVVISALGGFHSWLLLSNWTSLELRPMDTYNVFDQGNWLKNLQQLCGTRLIGFILPIPTNKVGDGITYPISAVKRPMKTENIEAEPLY